MTEPFATNAPAGELPASRSFLSLEPACVQLTSLAPGPDRTLDARLVNLDERPVTARIVGPYEPRAPRLRLDGAPLRGSVRLGAIPLRPCEILSLRLIPKGLDPPDRPR